MARPSRSISCALVLVGLVATAGCDTIGQDLSDFADSFVPPSPDEAARMALDPHDADDRRRGTLLLANAPFGGGEVYLRMYRDYVQYEQNPLVKAAAIRALARHGETDDAPLIADQLRSENAQVRWEAAKGLQRIHNPVVVSNLLAAMRDDTYASVREAAAIALGQYPEDRVFQGLLAALDARELEVNLAADQSLEMLTGKRFGLDRQVWYDWYVATDDPFADQLEYLYPTYQRKVTILERLAFWAPKTFEQPAPPTGLEVTQERSTYDSDDEALPPTTPDDDG